MNLTESQRNVLIGLLNGAANIPSAQAGRLGALGLVEKTGNSSGRRGYANMQLTEAGRAAVA